MANSRSGRRLHCDEALASSCARYESRELGNSRAPAPARGSPLQREALA